MDINDVQVCFHCQVPLGLSSQEVRRRLRQNKRKVLFCSNACVAEANRKGDEEKARSVSKTPTYHAWQSMLVRTRKMHGINAKHYALKGIGHDPAWSSFKNFLSDMGEKPPGMTLERLDSNLSYSKTNCVWADWATQSRNKSTNVYICLHGERMVVTDALKILGYSHQSFTYKRRTMLPQQIIDDWASRPKSFIPPWTHEEDAVLRELAADGYDSKTIGLRLGKSGLAIIKRAGKIGLRISPSKERISAICSAREARKKERNGEVNGLA